jgi:hypothetical protein
LTAAKFKPLYFRINRNSRAQIKEKGKEIETVSGPMGDDGPRERCDQILRRKRKEKMFSVEKEISKNRFPGRKSKGKMKGTCFRYVIRGNLPVCRVIKSCENLSINFFFYPDDGSSKIL